MQCTLAYALHMQQQQVGDPPDGWLDLRDIDCLAIVRDQDSHFPTPLWALDGTKADAKPRAAARACFTMGQERSKLPPEWRRRRRRRLLDAQTSVVHDLAVSKARFLGAERHEPGAKPVEVRCSCSEYILTDCDVAKHRIRVPIANHPWKQMGSIGVPDRKAISSD